MNKVYILIVYSYFQQPGIRSKYSDLAMCYTKQALKLNSPEVVRNLNIGLNEKNAQRSDSPGNQNQTQNNSNAKDRKDNNTTKSKSIQRCPKCRSINPPDAKYCQQCGKVFRTNE